MGARVAEESVAGAEDWPDVHGPRAGAVHQREQPRLHRPARHHAQVPPRWIRTDRALEEPFQIPGPVHLDKKGEKWARESLKKMSLEQKIGQMFMVRATFSS